MIKTIPAMFQTDICSCNKKYLTKNTKLFVSAVVKNQIMINFGALA